MFRFVSLLPLAIVAFSVARGQSVNDFFKDTFERMLRDDPEFATSIGRHDYDDRWTDRSKPARGQRRQFFEDRLKSTANFSTADLSKEDRLSLRILEYDFRSRLKAWDLSEYLLPVGQLFGLHNRVYLQIDRMPGRTIRDYENIISRLRAVPTYVDQNILLMDEAIAKKLTQPRVVAELVTKQLVTQVNQDATQTELLKAFREFPSNISQTEQQRLRDEATAAYEKQFLPAWHKLHDYMASTYTQHVRPADSLSSIPNGREDYAILIHRLTTTQMSAEQIHSLGEKEVARIEDEMQHIAAESGFKGSLAEYERHLEASPEQHFHSKEEMLVYCRNIAKIIEPELPNQFRHLPMLLYGVRPIPPDREAATATNAQAPSPDFTMPGWFNLNTYQPQKQVKYDKESLVLHEAVPGHIFQITLAQGQPNRPDIRKFYSNSAYVEGWALYAESLGDKLGLYRDPESRFGELASERFRAVRLVVDTGIHELGWSRERAIEYFRAHAPHESLAEVDRYISWPAQALSYKVGQLRIQSLRDTAEKRLGPKFDMRDFNDAVISEGTLPLDLLSEQIDGFIASSSARE